MGLGLELFAEGLPADVRVVRFEAVEGVSEAFSVSVWFDTKDVGFVVEDWVTVRVALTAREDGAREARVFDGVVEEVGFAGMNGDALRFRFVLRPRLFALAHRVDSRIFQEQSVVDVVMAVLSEAGLADGVEKRLIADYEPREYVVQYGESDLAFVSRLCEEEGIFYFFEHRPEGHVLVLGDHDGAFTEPESEEATVVLSRGQAGGGRAIVDLERVARLAPSHVHLRDFDVKQPLVPPEAVAPSESAVVPMGHYEYAAGFSSGKVAQRKAAARLRALRGEADVLVGQALAVGMVPGHRVRIDGFPEGAVPEECTVIRCRTVGTQASERASGGAAGGGSVASRTTFELIPKGAPWGPPLRTPRPKIRGYQIATVTAPTEEPETIHTDALGRVKIRFPWDRSKRTDDTSSAWVRVSQIMLGGAMILPRVGWEVVVSFEGGDPDRPLVIGKVYTAEEAPPVALPGAAADTSFASRSSPGGGGRNGLVLGDTAGSQGFSITAQKDKNVGVGNDLSVTIGANETISVGANASLSVGADSTTTIGGNQTASYGDALQVKIGGAQSVSVAGSETFGTTKDFVEHAGGALSLSIGGGSTTISNGVRVKASGATTRTVGAAMVTLSGGAITDTSASCSESVGAVAVTLAAGSVVESVSAAKTLTCSAAELWVGASLEETAASVTTLIGGVHLRKVGGDLLIEGSTVELAGAVGTFKAGGSSIKLSGGPIKLKAPSFKFKGATIIKMGSSLKEG
jgi:type VI secretion system secreted protein VgrG